jgi:glycosyltransferase involved in cell wall biosynthesis
MAAGVARTGYPRELIEIVPNGSDLSIFKRDKGHGRAFRQRLGIGDEKIVVGYAGTLGRVNGVGYLVNVATALKNDPRFVFLLIGDGQERQEIEAAARDRGLLNKSVFVHAQMAKAEMPAAFSAFDIATSLFLPIREMESNSANKFFDALASGCCVAINYGGWQEALLDEAQAGVRLAYHAQAAAQQLRDLAADPQCLEVYGSNARRLAVERFSRDVLAGQVEVILAKTVAEARRDV